MRVPLLPLIVEPDELEQQLGAENLLIVDLCPLELHEDAHIPGAIYLDRNRLVAGTKPAVGDLPSEGQLDEILSSLGVTADTHVVAYDDEGGGWAGRLLWTLDVLGHPHFSLLNGGICSWLTEGHPTSNEETARAPSHYHCARRSHGCVDKEYIKRRLGDPSVAILDARSPAEYSGKDRRAQRGGHIPGAVNLNWVDAMDRARKLRLKREDVLRQMLSDIGVSPDKEVIVYCQTHHRSSHTYIMLKALGFPNVKAYPGSWSEWGNSADTPIE